jgi:hypothetical protein
VNISFYLIEHYTGVGASPKFQEQLTVVSSSSQELTPKTTTTSKAAIVFAFMYFIISVKKLKKTPCLRQTRRFKI